MDNVVAVSAVSWLLPGVGHVMQGRWKRGLLVGGVIWTMFAIAVYSGGLYYPGFSFKDGSLLYLLNVFSKLGNGLGSVIGFLGSFSAPKDVASWATFEYGGRILEVAGLLNYLAVIDAADISIGRKE